MKPDESCSPVCRGFPPPDPPSLAVTDPLAAFRSFFHFRGMTEAHFAEAFREVMANTAGIHLFLIGSFWEPEHAPERLAAFEDFVCEHRVPVKVTWTPRWPGGPWGFYFFVAPLAECTLTWNGEESTLHSVVPASLAIAAGSAVRSEPPTP